MPAPSFLTDRLAGLGGDALSALIRVMATRPAAKPLHPRGRLVTARLHHELAGPPTGVPWLDETGEEEVLVRISRAVGLPAPLPDIHGLAIRVPLGEGSESAHGDLLFASTGLGPATRFLLTVAWRPGGRPMTTLLPYRSPRGPLVLGLRALDEDRFELLAASAWGPWARVGWLSVIGEAKPEDEHGIVSFDPVRNEVPGLRNYGWVRQLREPSYAFARHQRGQEGPQPPA